jgi:hypothetical protein
MPSNFFRFGKPVLRMQFDANLDNSLDSAMRGLTAAFSKHIDVEQTLAHLAAAASPTSRRPTTPIHVDQRRRLPRRSAHRPT